MNNIYNLTRQELEAYFISLNEKKFKATQMFEWLYEKRVTSFSVMTNLKKDLIDQLNRDFIIAKPHIILKQSDVNVNKYLFELDDHNKIEAVLMIHDYGNSLCISTQVGCNMGCKFCESGRLKKIRNLESYEMVTQIIEIEKDINARISHIVLMGIGEPFDNYDNVLKFIKIINDPKGMALGARHITISTCGLIDQIKKFMNEPLQVNLAISLHAPNDDIRSKLMPINKIYRINDLIETVKTYISKTSRRVTFEYILIDDVNDSRENAKELASILRGLNCYVNLIPYNETSYIEYKKSKKDRIMNFFDELKKQRINVTIRKEFGSKVDAACGQLRSNYR